MQMDGKRMGRDGEVGEWKGKSYNSHAAMYVVCMYVCTLSPLFSVAGSICSWNTAGQTGWELKLCIVIGITSSSHLFSFCRCTDRQDFMHGTLW